MTSVPKKDSRATSSGLDSPAETKVAVAGEPSCEVAQTGYLINKQDAK